MSDSSSRIAEVRDLYEDLPYPPVKPEEELEMLKLPYADYPPLLNHYGWQGKKRFDQDFRVLIAGGGTGNAAIYLGEQYGSLGAEVVYVDLSDASMAIAKERASLRKMDTITFHRASLLDVGKMGLGTFDYIDSSGVLHHLPDPVAGLAALTSVLKDDGVMSLMVYGQIGRTAIYQMQRMLQIALGNVTDRTRKIELGRQVVNHLTSTNWFNHNRHLIQHEMGPDEGFADLLLHPQDRAYTVPEIYGWLKETGLQMVTLLDHNTSGKTYYDPLRYLPNPVIAPYVEALSLPEAQELAELASGAMFKHSFYVSKIAKEEPDVADEGNVPVWCFVIYNMPQGELGRMVDFAEGPQLIFQLNGSTCEIRMTKRPSTAALLTAIDEKRTIAEIISKVAKELNFPEPAVRNDFILLYEEFRKHDLIFLRHQSVPPYITVDALQAAMHQRRLNAGADEKPAKKAKR